MEKIYRRWEPVLLELIRARGGEANTQQIYVDLEERVNLTADHLKATKYGRRPAYQHQVRSHLSNLVKAGDLKRLDRGLFELTNQGRTRIA